MVDDEFARIRDEVVDALRPDARIDSIQQSLNHLVFADGYPFNAYAFNQSSELNSAIQELTDLARAGNARARALLKAVHNHAVGCSDGIYAMRVATLYRGELRIACARLLAARLAEFAEDAPPSSP